MPAAVIATVFWIFFILWSLGVAGLCLWILFRPSEAKRPAKILAFMTVLVGQPFVGWVMEAENRAFPLKFDYFLYGIDRSLGVSAFWVARALTEWQRLVLFGVYQALVTMVIAWYGVNLKRRDGQPARLLIAYLITFLFGPALYLIVPACGPRMAFGGAFPWGNPDVSPVPVRLDYWPNAIPSLHVATALLFVFFSGRSPVLRSIAWLYLAGTVAATLAFEHYVIDLVVALPFACFATLLARGRFRKALVNLAVVLAWLLAIRFSTPELMAHPAVLRILALGTIVFGSVSLNLEPEPASRPPRVATQAYFPASD